MRRAIPLLAAGVMALVGCADGEQTATGIKTDQQPHAGTHAQPPFMAAGWKPGDRASWEAHIRSRTISGQNEYVKVP